MTSCAYSADGEGRISSHFHYSWFKDAQILLRMLYAYNR